ncbi:hypothetical protein HC174_00690 [Salinimicrobium sp. CDJ15-81-2]|nr:hypothetical protein [Salinimicrobium nanhaiense]
MKAKYYIVLTVIILMASCQKEEGIKEELEVEDAVVYEEFFIAEVDGEEFEVLNSENMSATRSVGPESGIPALSVFGYSEEQGYIMLYFCFYEGKGNYTTGNKKDVGYSLLWDDEDNVWEDLPQKDNPSEIEITYADDKIVEGTFDVTAYNTDDITKEIKFSGTFGVLLEEEDTEN